MFDGASPVSKALGDLRNTVEALDPSHQGDLLSPRKILGMIPLGNKIKAYFDGYRSAQNHLNAIIETLYRSKDELQRDNAAIETEKTSMWALMQKLEGFVYLVKSSTPRSTRNSPRSMRPIPNAPRSCARTCSFIRARKFRVC